MNKDYAATDPWCGDARLDHETILSELREILASPHFCNSKRYPVLLGYVVHHALAGKTEMLKERMLGVELFGRRPDYDTNTDTIVRYTASEVRKRLLLYYSELGRAPTVRISLPPGSYIPEFIPTGSLHSHGQDNGQERRGHDGMQRGQAGINELSSGAGAAGAMAPSPDFSPSAHLSTSPEIPDASPLPMPRTTHPRLKRALLAAAAAAVLGAAAWFAFRATRPAPDALSEFWTPVLGSQDVVLICTGSIIFPHQPNYSGTVTAGRDIDYTFVSMQIASAINQVGLTINRTGRTLHLLPSATTPLTQLRDHSVVLLGAYNNLWTMRLLEPLRFHFSPVSPGSPEAIVDSAQPDRRWQRNQSLPYSSADDYAIVARFHDPTIDGWVVALAGIGRNGTEAASHFATDPRYIQLLRNRMAWSFGDRNVEAVLKVNVVDGKTGAPWILAVHAW